MSSSSDIIRRTSQFSLPHFTFQIRKSLECMIGCNSLECFDDSSWIIKRIASHKKMNVVWHNSHHQNFIFFGFDNVLNLLIKKFFETTNKNFLAILWTPYNMIVNIVTAELAVFAMTSNLTLIAIKSR